MNSEVQNRPPGRGLRSVGETPADELVSLTTADRVELRGRWLRSTSPVGTVVLVHGFSAHQHDIGVRRLAEGLRTTGLDVLVYDSRGHAASGGECTLGATEALDVAAAVDRAIVEGTSPLFLVGVSVGVVAVVRYLADELSHPVEGAVLVSGPARWRMRLGPVGVATALLTRTALGRRFAARRLNVRLAPGWVLGESPERTLERVQVPVAVVHGRDDRLLAHSHARRLARSAKGSASLDVVAGMGHGLEEVCVKAVVRAVTWLRRAGPAVV